MSIFKKATEKVAEEIFPGGAPYLKTNKFYCFVWIFVIGCVIGYVVEVLYAFYRKGHFVNKQGMIYGPFNQIYGFGAVLFILTLGNLYRIRAIYIFIISTVVGAAFEFACSWIQQLVFGSVSWQYGKSIFNIDGRISLKHSLFWGILGVLGIKIVFPWFFRLLLKIPRKVIAPVSIIVFAFMIFNMSISALAVARQNERRHCEEPSNGFERFLDKTYPDEFLKDIYPNMKFIS